MEIKDKTNLVKDLVRTNFVIILALLLVFSSISNIIFYHRLSALKDNPQKAVQDQTAKLIKKVSKLINLPPDEQPTIATVSNPELLKDQPFFAKAEKGFKVLIYATAGKSILYDPFDNKVIEVASINIGNQSAPAPTPTPTPAPNKK